MHCNRWPWGAFGGDAHCELLHALPAPAPDWLALACTVARGSKHGPIRLSAMPAQGGEWANRRAPAQPIIKAKTDQNRRRAFVERGLLPSQHRQPTTTTTTDAARRRKTPFCRRQPRRRLLSPHSTSFSTTCDETTTTRRPHDRRQPDTTTATDDQQSTNEERRRQQQPTITAGEQ